MGKFFSKSSTPPKFLINTKNKSKLPSPTLVHRHKISAIYIQYAEILLKKRFNFYGVFYLSNLIFILITNWASQSHEKTFNIDVIRIILLIIVIIMLILFSLCLQKIIRSSHFKLITRAYFLILNCLTTIVFVEFSKENCDFSINQGLYYYFWMGYRLCGISIVTKIITRSLCITISTLLFELAYINIKFHQDFTESYKSLFISILLFIIYAYFFYFFEKFIMDDSQVKHYQKEDNKLFKKMLNRLPEALLIVNQKDHLFYSNFNAKNFIHNCSKTIIKTNLDTKTMFSIQDLFKNLKIFINDEKKTENEVNIEENIMKMSHKPYFIPQNETDEVFFNLNDSENLNKGHKFTIIPDCAPQIKKFSAVVIQNRIKEANLHSLFDLFQYFKTNITNVSDPIIHNLLKTHNENFSYDRFKKENYFTLEFYNDLEGEEIMNNSLINNINRYPSEFGFRTYYNVQMSIIEIREELHFVFLFDDITLQKGILQIQRDAIGYKDLLMASVSHELRTPLNGIINMIEHAMCESPHEIIDNFLDPALNSSKLLLSIISDFLDYSMINANKLLLKFSKFNLKVACMDCIQMIESQAVMKGIQIHYKQKRGTPIDIRSEPNRLKQVLLNLLSNAVKFTLQGEVTLEVSPNGHRILFSIKDTGIGINHEEKARIEKIISDDQYLSKVNKYSTGAGLGLKISSKLIELLNRSPDDSPDSNENVAIVCQSEYGIGSQFSFQVYNHDINQMKSIQSESNIFDTKNVKGGGIKVILSVQDMFKQVPENFNKIEEIKEDSSYDDYEHFNLKPQDTLNNFDEDPDKIVLESSGVNDINSIKGIKAKCMREKQEVYQFSTKLSMGNNEKNIYKNDEIKQTLINIDFISNNNIHQNNENFAVNPSKSIGFASIDSSPRPSITNKSILIVDDDFYNIEVLKFFLKSFNYQSEFANNGKEAVDKISQNPNNYLLIFMDFNMPIMDGIEATMILIDKMNKNEADKIPIIGVTAYVSEEDSEKALTSGMKEILHKPVKKEQVKEILEKYCTHEIQYFI